MDINIQEESFKCSKCGLCQSVCPLYLATKNEMFLPRGRFITLNNHFNNNSKLSKRFAKNLDICLNCNLCKSYCPSDIDLSSIIFELKNKYKRGNITKLSKIILPFAWLISKIFPFGIFHTIVKRVPIKPNKLKAKVAYFQGCFNRYVNSSDKNASLNLLEENGYEILSVINGCCGYSMLADGDKQGFLNNSDRIISSIPSEAKYIVCSCDSCFETLKKIPEITEKLVTIDNLLNIKIENANYYKPLIRSDNTIPCINKKGDATLYENFFVIKHPFLAKKIKKHLPKIDSDKDIFTTCQITKVGLMKRLKKKVYSYSEYIYKHKK